MIFKTVSYFDIEEVKAAKEKVLKYRDSDFLLDSENTFNFILKDNREIVGEADYKISVDEADLLYIYIDDPYRKKGYGIELLEKSLLFLFERGIKNVYLEVNENNLPALSLYKKAGFIKVGKREQYYGKENAYIMKKAIKEE
ncbi:MAG: GNAT family N-acetyltransferase [Bacillales bacterium]|nr:GNAT family N-acetyltransferase [Bacillales bacterium]